MNWRNVRLVFLREVRDQLRDRRTLFMIFILPLLLYPALGIGSVQMQVLFTEQPRTIVLLGTEHLPELPGHPLLKGTHFAPDLLERRGELEKITVITDAPQQGLDKRVAARRDNWLKLAREIAPDLPQLKELDDQLQEVDRELTRQFALGSGRDRHAYEKLQFRREAILKDQRDVKKQVAAKFTNSDLQLVVVIPEDFGVHLMQAVRTWDRTTERTAILEYDGPLLAYANALDKSQLTYRTVKEVFRAWESNFLKTRLREANLPENLTEPVHATGVNVALDEQESSSFWSKLLPALLVIMAMTGAFHPAIDLVAGEKERGTMETLLISPASRIEIVLGKFFTTMGFSCSTVLLNLTSMALTGKHMISMVASSPMAHRAGDLTLPSMEQMLWTLVLMAPLTALFSALCLALATLARSSKEGQYYLTPLLMVSMGITVFCMSPGIDLTPKTAIYTVVPIANIALLLKGLLGPASTSGPLYYMVGPVLITSFAYAGLALWWAIDQFQREEVLFRDTEQFDLRLWIRHLLRDKEPMPTFGEGVFCFGLIMLLQFLAMRPMQSALTTANPGSEGRVMLQLLLVQQLAVIATPALMMGVMLVTDIRRTFRLHFPPLRFLAIGLVLPVALHPLSWELLNLIPWPEQSPAMSDISALLSDGSINWWVLLLVFAVAPAICEEIAFRGFILSGFSRAGRMRLGIVLTSLAFGLMHMIPQQVFNASLIGIVLAVLAVRSHSLLPCVLFHFVNNAIGISMHHIVRAADHPVGQWFVQADADRLVRYDWPTLGLAVAIAAPLLWWLIARPGERMQTLIARRLGRLTPVAADASGPA